MIDMMGRENMRTLAQIVKQRRLALGLTQEQITDAVGLDQDYISQVERGKIKQPGRDVLERFARALDMPVGELLIAAGYYANSYALFFTEHLDIIPDDIRSQLDTIIEEHQP